MLTVYFFPQNSIIPGPPFLFGACSVLLALLVALFIPEHTNLSVRSSNWKKHCGSHSHPHSPQAPGEAKEPLLQDTNVWQKNPGRLFSFFFSICSLGYTFHFHQKQLLKVILRNIFLHDVHRNLKTKTTKTGSFSKDVAIKLIIYFKKILSTRLLPWNTVTIKLYVLVWRQKGI